MRNTHFMEDGQIVWSSDEQMIGYPTGAEFACRLEGCGGVRIAIVWANGKKSFPCSKGLLSSTDGNLKVA